MQTFLIISSLFFTIGLAGAQDNAEVMKRNGQTFVQYGEQLLSPTEVVPVNEDVEIYVVRSGDVGTSVIITVFRGIIWDKQRKQVLGMFPYKYKKQGGPEQKIDQPEWDIREEVIHIRDVNIELETTVNL